MKVRHFIDTFKDEDAALIFIKSLHDRHTREFIGFDKYDKEKKKVYFYLFELKQA